MMNSDVSFLQQFFCLSPSFFHISKFIEPIKIKLNFSVTPTTSQ